MKGCASVMLKVLFITNVPAPYRVDFFSLLGQYCELTVLYELGYSTERSKDWISKAEKTYQEINLNAKIRLHHGDSFAPSILFQLNNSYDLIIIGAHSSPSEKLAIEYMKLRKIPYLLNIDGVLLLSRKKDKKKTLKQHFFQGAEAYLVTGANTKNFLTYYGVLPQNIFIYPFTSLFARDIEKRIPTKNEKEEAKKKLGIKGKKIILTAGRFVEAKGHELLIRMSRDLSSDISIYILGDNPTDEYKRLCKQYGVESKIHFPGFKKKEELAEYYKAADVFVLPSRFEPWGLVINEAMSLGLPVIASDVCNAADEMIEDGVSGYILPSDTVEGWAEKINALLEHDNLRHRMAEASLAVAKQYTLERMVDAHLDIFDKIMEKRRK